MPDTRAPSDVLPPTAALMGAHIAVAATIERRAVQPTGLDATTCDLLLRISLSPNGQVRAVDLCRQLQLSASHVSRRLDRAIGSGLVQRTSDPDDRRARNITLTDAGRRALETFTPRLVEVVEEIVFETLDDNEVATLIGLLNRVEAAAISLQDDRPIHETTATTTGDQ